MQLDRSLPVRISLVVVSVLVFAGTLYAIDAFGYEASVAGKVLEALEGLLITLSIAIVGDSWRPSGSRVAAHKAVALMDVGAPPVIGDAPPVQP